jgi:hypothetical protein
MTDPSRTRLRLKRLAALEEAATRASERAFARASAELAGAAARLQQLEMLLQGAAPPGGAATSGALQAGAQLRRLLQPVADMAVARLDAARAEREDSEEKLRRCRARADAVARAAARADAAARAEEDRRAEVDRPAPTRKPAR